MTLEASAVPMVKQHTISKIFRISACLDAPFKLLAISGKNNSAPGQTLATKFQSKCHMSVKKANFSHDL